MNKVRTIKALKILKSFYTDIKTIEQATGLDLYDNNLTGPVTDFIEESLCAHFKVEGAPGSITRDLEKAFVYDDLAIEIVNWVNNSGFTKHFLAEDFYLHLAGLCGRRKMVYIAHPIGGDIENNLKDLRRILYILNTDPVYSHIVPFCPYYSDVVSLDDNIPKLREKGIQNDKAIFDAGVIDEVWLTGPRISAGMVEERKLAEEREILVIDLTNTI